MPRHSATSPRSFARFAAAASVAAVLASGGLLVAAPASAHDELVGTDPAADSTVDRSPAQIALTFGGEISAEPGASVVDVTDAEGTSLAGDPVATDNVLLIPIEGEASGAVTVVWKVVSNDGHPISGQFGFTVIPAVTPTSTPTPTPSAPEPVETVSPTPSAVPVPGEDSTFESAWPWVIGGILVIGAGGAIVYLLVTRAQQQAALAKAREAAPTDRTGPPADR